jgi:polyhydroxyalkanoate synthesis regulator phasin
MEELDIPPSHNICELDSAVDPWEYAISANLHRRHLTTSQRAMVAASLAGLKRGRPELNGQKCPSTLSNAQAAKKLTVSPMAVKQAKAVQEQCSKPIQEMVKQGELTVSAAQNLAKAVPDKKEQAKLAKQGTQAVKTATKTKAVVKTPLEQLYFWWAKASDEEREEFDSIKAVINQER